MNNEDFNEEVRRERIESDAQARTLEDEIEDRESDIRDLHKVVEEYVQRLARATEALASHRAQLRDSNARNEAQQDELNTLRGVEGFYTTITRRLEERLEALNAEHEAGKVIVRNLTPKRPMLDPEFIAWMDAHDRTEMAK